MACSNTLVFLPGWGYQASVWQPVIEALPTYQTLLLDWPESLDDESLHHLGNSLPDHAVLIGWSLGGSLAIQLCSLLPEKFSRLVLVASSPCFIANTDWPGIQPEAAEAFIRAAACQPAEHLKQFHQLVLFPTHSRQDLRFLQNNAAKPHPTVIVLNHFLRIDLRASYNSLKLPVLSLAGERDAVLPPHPSDRIFPGAGHAFFLSHRTSFVNALHDFLDEPGQ